MAGFDVLTAVEYDPVHAATHLFNFPNTPVICKDIRKITKNELLRSAQLGWTKHHPELAEWDGCVDVVIGGPSCQGFSAMGKQDVNDDRNELVSEFVRLVREIRPRAFVMENVPGILAPQFRELLSGAIADLEASGYLVQHDLTPLDASEFGVPQRRKRVFLVGALDGVEIAPPVALVEEAPTARDALEGLPAMHGRRNRDGDGFKLNASQRRTLIRASNPYLNRLRGATEHRSSAPIEELSGCRITEHKQSSIERFQTVPQGGTESVSRAWRLNELAPARTLRAGTGRERGAFSAARPLHPREPRVITIREAARLHSFPDWFRFHTTNWHGHRQIGNAVPPLLASSVATSVRRALKHELIPQEVQFRGSAQPTSLLSMSPTEATAFFEAAPDEIPPQRKRDSANKHRITAKDGRVAQLRTLSQLELVGK